MFKSLKGEFGGIFKSKKMLIAIIGILFIPLLYSGTYLWAFWDPYGHVERMPVAVVNHDEGADYNGKKLTIGDDLVKKLKDKKTFHYDFVTKNEADSGLQHQKYYIKIEIPKDFSQNATTLQNEKPKNLNLIYTPNEGANYLSSKIGDSAIEKMKEEVSAAVTKTYAEAMFENIKDVAKGLDEASGGAGGLNDGINSAKKGAGDLHAGINTAKDGAGKLNKGAGDLHSGAAAIQKNLETLAEKSVTFSGGLNSATSGSKELNKGLQQFGAGLGQMKEAQVKLLNGAKSSQAAAAKLSDGLDHSLEGMNQMESKLPELTSGAENIAGGGAEVSKGAGAVDSGLANAIAKIETIAQSSNEPAVKEQLAALKQQMAQLHSISTGVNNGVKDLSNGATRLEEGQKAFTSGFNQLAAGQQQMADGASSVEKGQGKLVAGLTTFGDKIGEAQTGLHSLTKGSASLSTGLGQLAKGSGQLEDGTSKLANGSKDLTKGTSQLSEGSSNLANGMHKLDDGSNKLDNGMNKLSDGSKKLSDKLKDGAKNAGDVKTGDDVYDMFAKPVDVKEQRINKIPNYGTALAPYFLSLSLYVGALVLSIIFPLRNPAVTPTSGFSWFASKLGVMLTVGVFQALLVDFALLQWVGLEVKSVPYLILLSVITSWTYLAIIQFLVTAFDNPGRFVGILILIMQLTSSAGTFPIELSPKLFQDLNQYLPMTYSIAGFRSVISTGDYEFLWYNIGTITIFFAVFLLATLAYFRITYRRMKHVFAQES